MRLFPLYIFHIVVYAAIPIISCGIIISSDVLQWNIHQSATNVALGFLLVQMVGTVMFIPRSTKELDRIGFKSANRVSIALDISRRFWAMCVILSFVAYTWFFIDAKGITPGQYYSQHPEISFVPIVMIISLLSFSLSYWAFSNWRGSKYLCLFMARELCKLSMKNASKIDRMTKLIESLRWYGRYLWIVIDLKIADFDSLTARILSQNNEQQRKTVETFYQAFVNGDELEPLQILNLIHESKNSDGLLVRENLLFYIKKYAAVLTIITSVITAIGSIIVVFVAPNIR